MKKAANPQVGYSRLGHYRFPISGEPEIGEAASPLQLAQIIAGLLWQ
jgi:hypothetical protein